MTVRGTTGCRTYSKKADIKGPHNGDWRVSAFFCFLALRDTMDREQIITRIRRAGVVGQGGAGFPTHVKLDARVDTVIANGCECEPLLATDRRIMLDAGEGVLRGLHLAMKATNAERGILAIKAKHKDLARWFAERVNGTAVSLRLLENFYPAGDEQTLVKEVTGRYIAPLSLPKEAGCVVCNVGTLQAVAEAVDGIPVTRKVVTVTGEVARPSVFTVPVGCSLAECIAFCGGPRRADSVVVLGGPMMGRVLETEDAVRNETVSKTLGGIILLPRGHHLHQTAGRSVEVMRRRAATACIQCRFCSDLCPRYLIGQPFETHRVMRAFASGTELTSEAGKLALLCCGCGVCEHVACPMELSPCTINTYVKAELARAGVKYGGERAEKQENTLWREARRVPLPRLAARTGITDYMGIEPEACAGPEPVEVAIPLKQHIGAPAVPVCAEGDRVAASQVIAEIPENALGAAVHASIDGVVVSVDASIRIRRAGHV